MPALFFERRPVLITITSDGDNPTDVEALIYGSALAVLGLDGLD